MNHKIKFLIFIILLMSVLYSIAKEKSDFQKAIEIEEEEYTITAGRVELFNTPQGRITLLDSAVTIVHGSATITAEHGEAHEIDESAYLSGNVKIVDKGRTINSMRANYFKKEKRACVAGEVIIVDSMNTLFADSAVYFRDEEYALVFGRVVITSSDKKRVLKGGKGIYEERTGHGTMLEKPVLFMRGEKLDTLITIEGEKMEFFDKEDKAEVFKNVLLKRKDNWAKCEHLVYLKRENRAILYENPVAYEEGNHLKGNEMEVLLRDEKVEKVVVKGDAEGEEIDSTGRKKGMVRGDTLNIFLGSNERVEKTQLIGNAYSEYFAIEDGGKNIARGDTIVLTIRDGKVKKVEIIGKARGIYYNEKKEFEEKQKNP